MPAIRFYIPDTERMELFEFIKDHDGNFIPDLLYDNPQTIQIETGTELIRYIYNIESMFFIVSPLFQVEPLALKQFEEKYERCAGKYSINQRTGGPYITVSFSKGFDPVDTYDYIKYNCTDIDHYARYMHSDWPKRTDEFHASEELKAYYKMIVTFLKSKCKHVTAPNGKKYWVSKYLLGELALA